MSKVLRFKIKLLALRIDLTIKYVKLIAKIKGYLKLIDRKALDV